MSGYSGAFPVMPPQQPQPMQIQLPWPLEQVGSSNAEVHSRSDVMLVLKKFRADIFGAQIPFDRFVWSLHRTMQGQLLLYLFNADYVPHASSVGEAWVFHRLSEDPPADGEPWPEAKFVRIAPTSQLVELTRERQ